MSAAQVDPHDKMRSRDVNKVARGEQAPRPVHAPGTVSPPPPNKPKFDKKGGGGVEEVEEEKRTPPADERLPETNQTRLCYTQYLEYRKCVEQKGKEAKECQKLANYFHVWCPNELMERWDKQRKLGTLPGSI